MIDSQTDIFHRSVTRLAYSDISPTSLHRSPITNTLVRR